MAENSSIPPIVTSTIQPQPSTHSSPTISPTTPASTTVTTPEQSPGNENGNDDIWASDSDHERNEHPLISNANPSTLLSDIPTIRRQHMTDGYREGLSIGKARVMQSGFDAGYPIGVALAIRAGIILGTLEGAVAALKSDPKGKQEVEKLVNQAKDELRVTELLRGVEDNMIADMAMQDDGKVVSDLPAHIETALAKWEHIASGIPSTG